MTAVSDKLERAQEILAHPLTLDSIREFNELQDAATGEEADRIADLGEALFVAASADEALFQAAMDEGLL
ncbi:hypothetical protein ACOI2Q_15475 [Shewanella algae]|uniref:hypothetical protein n=1 Tax=Shewanella algae TaxID=38313 RepID=UPI003B6790E6